MEPSELTEPIADWRSHALNEALQAEARYGEGMDALLCEIRRHLPAADTLLLWPDRIQLLRFLETQAEGFRSLLPGSYGHIERNEVCPFLDWYAAEWQGARVEIALPPGTRVDSCVIVIGTEKAALRRFADALENYALRPVGRCLRYSQSWKSAPDLDAEIGKVTWDDLVLEKGLMTGIREAVEGFFQNRDAFTALGFPWRRGVLLIGPPGTGKTMICKAAAAALPDLPFLYVRDFRPGEDENHKDAVKTIFRRARKLAPCLLSFEDIDGLVTEENRTVFLNELDGFQNNEGVFIIASSNHPDKIDSALLKRPSRFDRVFHVGLPALPERREYCLRLLSRSSLAERLSADFDSEALARKIAERSHGFTPAYLKEVFVSAALRQAQDGVPVLDERFTAAALAQVDEIKRHLRRMKSPDSLSEFSSSENDFIGIRRNRV